MSNQENDRYKEAGFEDFEELYDVSSSFRRLVEPIISDVYDLDMGIEEILGQVFDRLWANDCELLLRDKRSAVEAYLMYKDSMKKLRSLVGNV